MYTLYVIPGSHACRSAMLMLDHKRVPYRRVDIVTLLHPLVVRLHGFDAGGQTRNAGGRRTFGVRLRGPPRKAPAGGARSGGASAIASERCRRSPPTASASQPATGSHASWKPGIPSRGFSRPTRSGGARAE